MNANNQCKVRTYSTEDDAMLAAFREVFSRTFSDPALYVYCCPNCHRYHLTKRQNPNLKGLAVYDIAS